MRVLHVTWSMLAGGLERVVLDLVGLAPSLGLTPLVVSLAQGGPFADRLAQMGVPYWVLGKREGLDFRMIPRVASLLRRQKVDVIHAHNQGAMLYAGLAGLLTGRPMVSTRHGTSRSGEFFRPDPSYRLLSRLMGHLCRYTICVGGDSYNIARRLDKVPESRLRLIYNGVDTARFTRPAGARERVRDELGLSGDHLVMISVGRLSYEKDQASLLKALDALREELPGLRLVLVGGGPEMEPLKALSQELDLGSRALILGERDDVPDLLAAADLFVLPSLSEGISIALLEAMAAGLPIVATRVGGNHEVVDDGVTGILTPPASPSDLAQAIRALAADPGQARDMGQAGLMRAEQKFSLAATGRAYARLYEQALGG